MKLPYLFFRRTLWISILSILLLCFSLPVNAGKPSCCSFGKAMKRGFKNIRNTLKKAERDARRETGNALHNVVKESGTAVQNVADETVRVGPHVVDFGAAVVNYTGRSLGNYSQVFNNAGKRLSEGKLADALFHVALDPLRNEEKNLFKLTQESSLARSMGAIAASAYGGPSGAAAYAAWQTYRATNGNAELAIRAGVLAGFTHMANTQLGQMKLTEEFALIKKTVIAGAIGGLAIAASGGDDRDILDGFILAGGMVIIQDGYINSTGQPLDARAATGDSYCAAPNSASCEIFKNATYTNKNGNSQVDFSKLDRRASYVGEGYMPNLKGQELENWMKDSWKQDRSPFMKGIAKVPGVNAMALYHDDWVLSWKMQSDAAIKGTIIPALVMTYYGTGQMLSDKITDLNSKQAGNGPRTMALEREDLTLQPGLMVSGTMPDQKIPKELDVDPANTKRTGEFYVAQTDIANPGQYIMVRNVVTGALQRALVIGGLPVDLKGSKNDYILLSPEVEKSLGLNGSQRIVQAEPEDLILVSTVDPAAADRREVESAYYNKGDTLAFSDFNATETIDWHIMIMGPGGGKEIENFKNNWAIDLDPGDYMYVMKFDDPKQLPWGYQGFLKVMGKPETGIWETTGNDGSPASGPFLLINGHAIAADIEKNGSTLSIISEDSNIMLSMLNFPTDNSTLTDAYFASQCQSCFGIMLTDTKTARTFIGIGGTLTRSGKELSFNFEFVELLSISDKNATRYKVNGRYVLED